MNMRVTQGYGALTEKEKQTLRLILRGHDAKSIARTLDLSVHTINERLREARRKMAVSSSREAARLLLDTECETPDFLADTRIGEAATAGIVEREGAPIPGAGRPHRLAIMTGVVIMLFAAGFLALAALPQLTAPTPGPSAVEAPDPSVVDAARQFLALGDQARWDDAYQLTGRSFQLLNSSQLWASVSQQVRVPLGAVTSRVLISQENLPAPPAGYEVVKFRTSFANKADVVETVTLEREDGNWRVVGVTLG